MNQELIERAARALFDNTDRDLDGGPNQWDEDLERSEQERYRRTARAVIAAIHPTVSSVEELDALGDRAVVRSDEGDVFEFNKPYGYWMETGFLWEPSSRDIALPATVLDVGGAA